MNSNDANSENGSNPWSALSSVKLQVLERIQALAQQGDTAGLIKTNDWLRVALNVETAYQTLAGEAEGVVQKARDLIAPNPVRQDSLPVADTRESEMDSFVPGSGSSTTGGKARGQECRARFVDREAERGRSLKRVRGQLYMNTAGQVVESPMVRSVRSAEAPGSWDSLPVNFRKRCCSASASPARS